MLGRITLNNFSHENDKYPYEKIILWLNKLLGVDFLGKNIIEKQLSGATYEVYGAHEYIDVKFKPNYCERFPYIGRTPITMIAKQQNGNVVDFLLHIIDGYVYEMEIYNVDLTTMNGDFDLDDVEYIVDEGVKNNLI